jgi:hypothetical protein
MFKQLKKLSLIKKSAAILAAATAITLGLGALPANAWVDYRPTHHVDSVETVTVGTPFDVDYSCSNGAINDGLTYNFNSGNMPPGLSFDPADSHIKGTPTQIGDYELPFVLCFHDGFDEGFSIGHINVQPPATPTPGVTATALNNADCEIRIVGTFPVTPDAGTATLTLSNPGATIVATLASPVGGTLVDVTVSAANLTDLINNPAVASTEPSVGGDFNQCDGTLYVTLGYQYLGAPRATASTDVNATRGTVLNPAEPCAAGTFSIDGYGTCSSAAPGHYVAATGGTEELPCPLGTFAPNSGSASCTPAPAGTYVSTTGATSATACPTGQVTLLAGARSHFECFKVVTQTIKAVKLPTKSKFGAKVLVSKTTDLGAPLTLAATGACTVKSVKASVVVKGKKTSVNRYQITMKKVAGNCDLTFANAGDDSHTSLTAVKHIKVTK